MKTNGFLVFATCCLILFSITSCQKGKGLFGKKKSSTTGWTYNDSKNGGIEYNEVKSQQTGPGLVFIHLRCCQSGHRLHIPILLRSVGDSWVKEAHLPILHFFFPYSSLCNSS